MHGLVQCYVLAFIQGMSHALCWTLVSTFCFTCYTFFLELHWQPGAEEVPFRVHFLLCLTGTPQSGPEQLANRAEQKEVWMLYTDMCSVMSWVFPRHVSCTLLDTCVGASFLQH